MVFPPTYRMERGKQEYSNKKNQNPSYTDRVLYRSINGLEVNVSPLFYSADMYLDQVLLVTVVGLHLPSRASVLDCVCDNRTCIVW